MRNIFEENYITVVTKNGVRISFNSAVRNRDGMFYNFFRYAVVNGKKEVKVFTVSGDNIKGFIVGGVFSEYIR